MDRHKQTNSGNYRTILVTMTGSTLSTTVDWTCTRPSPSTSTVAVGKPPTIQWKERRFRESSIKEPHSVLSIISMDKTCPPVILFPATATACRKKHKIFGLHLSSALGVFLWSKLCEKIWHDTNNCTTEHGANKPKIRASKLLSHQEAGWIIYNVLMKKHSAQVQCSQEVSWFREGIVLSHRMYRVKARLKIFNMFLCFTV